MHIGTNNLRTDKPQVVSEKIIHQIRVIEQQLPDTKLGVSSLIRNNDQVLNNKLTAVNKSLTRFCKSNGWEFIDNSNIGSDWS